MNHSNFYIWSSKSSIFDNCFNFKCLKNFTSTSVFFCFQYINCLW